MIKLYALLQHNIVICNFIQNVEFQISLCTISKIFAITMPLSRLHKKN